MPRFKQRPASRGSQKWLQILVNDHQELLHQHLATSLKLPDGDTIRWLSPLKDDDFAEYRDQAFLDRLGIALDLASLKEFWPRRGPQWDGLARTDSGTDIRPGEVAYPRDGLTRDASDRAGAHHDQEEP